MAKQEAGFAQLSRGSFALLSSCVRAALAFEERQRCGVHFYCMQPPRRVIHELIQQLLLAAPVRGHVHMTTAEIGGGEGVPKKQTMYVRLREVA